MAVLSTSALVVQAVESDEKVARASGGGGDGRAVGIDVVLGGGVGVEDDVVNHLVGVAQQAAAQLVHHGDDGVLVQVVGPGHLGHQLVGRQRLARRGRCAAGDGGVLGPGEPVDVAKLEWDLKRVAGHLHRIEQRRDRGLQVDIVPQGAGLLGIDQLVARPGGGGVHGCLQVGLPVLQHARAGAGGLAELRRQQAAGTGEVEVVHASVLAEQRARTVADVMVQQRQFLTLPPGILQLGQLRSQPLHLLAKRRNLCVHPRLVELADAAQFPFHQLQAGSGEGSVVSGHRSSKIFFIPSISKGFDAAVTPAPPRGPTAGHLGPHRAR